MKSKKPKPPRKDSYLPPDHRRFKLKTMRFLKDWNIVRMPQSGTSGVTHVFEYILAPDGKVYRRAYPGEEGHLLIDMNILPPEHAIVLVRVTNKPLRIAVKKRWRKLQRMFRGES